MVQTSMNIFDLIVIGVIGMSALLSFFRGFVREVMSLGAWLGASLITLYSFQTASDFIKPQVGNDAVAGGIAAISIFLVSLILISIVNGLLLKFLKTGSDVGVLDNVVGLTFGVARGILLVSICYFMLTIVMSEKDYPMWVKQSATRPYVAHASKYIGKIAPDYLSALSKSTKNKSNTSTSDEPETEKHKINIPSMEELQQRMREENEKILKENP